MKTRIFYVVMALVMTMAVALAVPLLSPGTALTGDPAPKTQLAMILDGSASINATQWTTIVNGLAAAVNSSECVPADGSVELTVVQFGGESAQLEVGPVVITAANVAGVADDIMAILQMGGATPMACGICLAADTLFDSPNFNSTLKQALNLVTDGLPNVCCCSGDSPGTYDCNYDGFLCYGAGEDSAECARDYAISKLEMTENQDEFDAEGIGITDTNRDWLKNNIIFPATGYSSPPESWPPPGPGWVRVVDTFQEFADTICEKIKIVVEPTGACCDPATGSCTNDVLEANCEAPLEWNKDKSCAEIVCVAPECTTAADCDDGNVCTTDTCVAGTCQNENNTLPCADGNACTTNDTCADGTCGGGSAVTCSDPDDCNTAACDPAGLEGNCDTVTPKADTTPCGDPSASDCDDPDTCSAGTCLPNNETDGTVCPDDGIECTDDVCSSGVCTHPDSAAGTPCDDGNDCTTGDICADGTCSGIPMVCDDGNTCTDDECVDGVCVYEPDCVSAADCDDGDPGTVDTCDASGCCHSVVEPELDFGDAPEEGVAYPPGVMGKFPTCMTVGPSTWIQHGLGWAHFGPAWDPETDGDAGLCPGCFPTYDDDECFADGDAGLIVPEPSTIDAGGTVVTCPNSAGTPLGFTCHTATWGTDVDIWVVNNMPSEAVGYVNVLMDWNQDGQWAFDPSTTCAAVPVPEHVLVNQLIPPGYSGPLSALGPPTFQIGPNPGYVWTRFTISERPVGMVGAVPLSAGNNALVVVNGVVNGWHGEGEFEDGETEDYLLSVYEPPPPQVVTGVPTLSQWGMIAMGILFAAFLIWTVRRRWVVSADGSQE